MTYVPGHSVDSLAFMGRRRAATHAAFFTCRLRTGMELLDAGCGPGTITLDLARIVDPGSVVGFDRNADQFADAERTVERDRLNVRFVSGNTEAMPFADSSFDVVFAHALIEHCPAPERVIAEFRRVLRPGGLVGLRSPDWGGFVLNPYPSDVAHAIQSYVELMTTNGADPYAGRKLGGLLRSSDFEGIELSASYEIYERSELIAEYLARQLDGYVPDAAAALRAWHLLPGASFAQAWFETIARKPN